MAIHQTFPMSHKARYIMIGGFLGAGKTTAVARLAQRMTDRGLRVGLITNDQGSELVDTKMLRSKGFATEEIPGGCFCCRFNSLMEAADRLGEASRPDVFIAEPVGSCTDLVATVTYPLRRIYGDNFSIAPLSVLVDPIRARRVLGLEEGGNFSPKVVYIYRKQLEEADVIVVSKCELLGRAQLDELEAALRREFPLATVIAASPREGTNLNSWFGLIESAEQQPRGTMEVDYGTYAEGEALLGWLNATIQVTAEDEFDAQEILMALAMSLQARLSASAAEVAHLKMTLSPDGALGGEVAVINLVRTDYRPELCLQLDEPVEGGQIILNLRAEADPDALAGAVRAAIIDLQSVRSGLELKLDHLEHFRPGKPMPTHRDRVGG
jgi:G3E family GTPase